MQYLSEIIFFVVGAASGSLLTLSFSKKSAKNGGSVVDQSRAKAGGDIIAGNKSERK